MQVLAPIVLEQALPTASCANRSNEEFTHRRPSGRRPKTGPLQGENDCGLRKGNNQGSIFLAPPKTDAQNTERLHDLSVEIVAS